MLRWKERIERRLTALETAQRHDGQTSGSTAMVATAATENAAISSFRSNVLVPDDQPSIVNTSSGNTDGTTLNLASKLGMFPAASIGNNTPQDTLSTPLDIISQGLISLGAAQECLDYFLKYLNQYLHHILSAQTTLAEVRAESSLLTTAICTVASFCSAADSYKACHDAFVSQVSGMLFATHNSYDDVRALCIAAFWLDDIGPTLSGLGRL